MHSIRTRIVAMTAAAIVIVMVVATAAGTIAIRNIGNNSANQILLLLCETGEKNLDHYFTSVEQSVEMVSAYVESDLDGLDDDKLAAHMDRVDDIFKKLTYRTVGVATYYYRIDPAISRKVRGFWYVNTDGNEFKEHEVTDLTLYDDSSDKSGLVWFTVPKETGGAVWLPPYITENLDLRVISYNVPVYYEHQFIGVIGIEIDYSTMAQQVDNIKLYNDGYAFINDAEGRVIYHPKMDVTTMKQQPVVPEGLLSDDKFIRYKWEGVTRQAVWLTLENGMRLNVTVPVREINEEWLKWSLQVILIFTGLFLVFMVLILLFANRLTKPLVDLANAAQEVNEGNYDVKLTYEGKDEVGTLTKTFNKLTAHLKSYIGDLNDLAYADALTAVHNRGAFDIYVKNLQIELEQAGGAMEFAVCMFDCNYLKKINDTKGHDKGDIYLRETAKMICTVFEHSPVFRIGGDEFAAILQGDNYEDREDLIMMFDERCADKRITENELWEEINVARGLATYDRTEDRTVNDVILRADRMMYENKWETEHRRIEDEVIR